MLKKITKYLPLYITFFIPIFVIITLYWRTSIDGKLYYCSDSLPLLDFIPPFVHGPLYGDHFIADPQRVWSIWYLLFGLMTIVPFILTVGFYKVFKVKKNKN